MIFWRDAESALVWDGSLWEMYVQDTDVLGWDRVLSDIKTRKYELAYSVSGQEPTLTSAVDVFALNTDLLPSLFVRAGTVRFDTYFVREDQIVFVVFPKEVHDQESLNHVADFMTLLGEATQKNVVLSPDSLPDYPFITYLTTARQFHLHNKVG